MTDIIRISVVVPVYAGEGYLLELIGRFEQLCNNWKSLSCPLELMEVIFVNDESVDNSLNILYKAQESRSWLTVINLSRNYGQHQATVAGILHSSGDWVVTLDEDLQHDPLLIENMLKVAIGEEQDVVYAHPEEAVHKSVVRDYTSKQFKKVIAILSNNEHVRKFNSYRLVRGAIARASASVCSHGTYYDMVLSWFTNRVTSVSLPLVDLRYIETGKSGYSIRTLLSHARKMLISSETKIVRLGAGIGFIALLFVVVIGAKVLFDKLLSPGEIVVQGWTSLFLSLLFFGGLISILLGVVLEYISVIILHIQGKPTFFIVDRTKDKVLTDYFK